MGSFKERFTIVRSRWRAYFLNLNEQKKKGWGLGDSHSSFKGDLGPLENSKTALAKTKIKQNWRWSLVAASFNKEINSVVKTNFFQMRALAKIKNVLSSADFEKVIHAFILFGLDYCNSFYFVISQALLCCLQRMQQLDCCQAHGYRIDFKILLVVFFK